MRCDLVTPAVRSFQVEAVTDRMPEAAVNLHGTRCVQKVVEVRLGTFVSSQQRKANDNFFPTTKSN